MWKVARIYSLETRTVGEPRDRTGNDNTTKFHGTHVDQTESEKHVFIVQYTP